MPALCNTPHKRKKKLKRLVAPYLAPYSGFLVSVISRLSHSSKAEKLINPCDTRKENQTGCSPRHPDEGITLVGRDPRFLSGLIDKLHGLVDKLRRDDGGKGQGYKCTLKDMSVMMFDPKSYSFLLTIVSIKLKMAVILFTTTIPKTTPARASPVAATPRQ